ncbi:MAG: hypothetical protein NZ518_11265, partial [Dehalococcoidia bacterium]|nr:hypothetical protein [Dehalococcoidia bacterium]
LNPLLPQAALALAGFPPPAIIAPQAIGLSPRAPAPPPDSPLAPYAPVQFRPPLAPIPFGVAPGGALPPGVVPGTGIPVGPVAPGAVTVVPPTPAGVSPFVPAPPPAVGVGVPVAPVVPFQPVIVPGAPIVGLAAVGPNACLGDEEMIFVPNPAPANVEFSVEVSSARYQLGVGLIGPGAIRLREVVPGGRGTVWKFGVTVGAGQHSYIFTRGFGQFGCVQGNVRVAVVNP